MEKKDKIQICITGVLVIIFIMLLLKQLGGGKKIPEPIPMAKADDVTMVQAGEGQNLDKALIDNYEQLLMEANALAAARDPFSKPKIKKEQGPSLFLMGIAWDEDKPQAIINDTIVEVGSPVGEFYVVEIKRDRVIMTDDNKTVELVLGL